MVPIIAARHYVNSFIGEVENNFEESSRSLFWSVFLDLGVTLHHVGVSAAVLLLSGPLLPAASLKPEAGLQVADRGQGQSLWGDLLADAGEAGVRLGRAELRDELRAAESALQR